MEGVYAEIATRKTSIQPPTTADNEPLCVQRCLFALVTGEREVILDQRNTAESRERAFLSLRIYSDNFKFYSTMVTDRCLGLRPRLGKRILD